MASASAEVHRVPETAQSGSPAIWPPPEPEPVKVKRDGVPLTEELIRRKAEHNEGMLSTLEEIALHQLDIDRIETLNSCRHLKIVYLQSNLIRKLENLHRLKELDYLNVALNNISKIENLEGCESLRKLDMTVNFVDLDHLHTVASLKNNTQLRELFLTGNPCAVHWESGYRDYVVATLPQLEQLDGKAILKAERIKAMQRLPDLERELALLAGLAKERKEEKADRRREKQRAIAAREMEDDEKEDWCIETRVEDARQLRETEEAKNEYRKKAQTESLFGDQAPRARRMFKDDGSIVQMNTAKWPFSIEEDGLEVRVDIALPKFLDSAQVGTARADATSAPPPPAAAPPSSGCDDTGATPKSPTAGGSQRHGRRLIPRADESPPLVQGFRAGPAPACPAPPHPRPPPRPRPALSRPTALSTRLATAQIDADVQPLYVRVTAKKSILQLLLPSEVLIDASKCTARTLTS